MTNKISVIIPVFNEEKHIQKSIEAIIKVLTDNNISHRLVIIDDGSTDKTWSILKILTSKYTDFNAIKLSRNFGKEAALSAGLDASPNSTCITMDCDLQHPPSLIPKLVKLWKEGGYEVVEAIKIFRGNEKLINQLSASFFYTILHKLSGFNLDGASDYKLLDAKVVAAWSSMGERDTFFRGMSAWSGFKRTQVPFVVANRVDGKSKWSIFRLFKLSLTAITSFSSIPLHIVTFTGIVFLLGSVALAIQTLYMKFSGTAVSGFTTVILLLLIIGSALMISLGIIGVYIAKIFDEVKHRPRYLVSEKINNGE